MNEQLTKPLEPKHLAKTRGHWIGVPVHAEPAPPTEEEFSIPDQFDRSILLERVGGDEKICDHVLEAYLGDVPNQIGDLERAISDGDATIAHRIAHTLKGASGSVGATVLQEMALHMETAAEQGDLDAVKMKLDEFEREFEFLKNLIDTEADEAEGE